MTGRTVSDESVSFCRAMEDSSVSPTRCAQLFRAAIHAHTKYISDACEGYGVDRHLFGLKQLLPPDTPKPGIFTDPANAYSSSWFLSTSQLSSEWYDGYGWSQVIDEGFGVAYMINEDHLNFNVVCKGLGADRFKYYLGQAADDIKEVMEAEVMQDAPKAKL